ncbi:MAG: alanine--tRNA ligase, partial [Candidatus Marinimicrobia bacterium]|nr:alanine--tRNA ligase [Candidatus Neomarinimicrobiota bacterium]
SGKHNDLEEVGVDSYHHTFFEMLGNWSFGDYYKAEAIGWAWELLTVVWGMDKARLWATVHDTDDEAARLWTEVTDIAPDQVLRFGDKENFWEMGATGPCGPCSEIHYYDGPDMTDMQAEGVNAWPEFKELWNLVFIQNNRLDDGSLADLPARHVDTGAGLERIVAVLQGQGSNYATDLFSPLIDHVAQLTGVPYTEKDGVAHRVLADHIRMLSFSLADGAIPSNEGRGYVVRRILRRAARFGRMLGRHEPFIYKLVDTVGEVMGAAYPEIIEKRKHVENVIKAEEIAFGETLDRGLEEFDRATVALHDGDTLSGDEAFKLYDTYGFPLDLTQLMARENGLEVDTAGFDEAMAAQRQRARRGGKSQPEVLEMAWQTVTPGESSAFLGYETTESGATIRQYRLGAEGLAEVLLDRTPFYGEAGGQVGDTGVITGKGFEFRVEDTQHQVVNGRDEIVHSGRLVGGDLQGKKKVTATVDGDRRQAIRLNHTATHLLHKALKVELGEHVQQAGSLVAPDRLRFDFSHFDKLTDAQVANIELLVNGVIRANHEVGTEILSFDEARKSGAVAMFGEKYGDEVRVLDVPDFSRELCGGTHVDRTGDIGMFKITSETALASGVRRMEAVTGAGAVEHFQSQAALLNSLSQHYHTNPQDLVSRIQQDQARLKDLERQLKQTTRRKSRDLVGELSAQAVEVGKVAVVAAPVNDIADVDQLKDLAVAIKDRLKSAVVVLYADVQNKAQAVIAVTDDQKGKLPAGAIAKEVGRLLGGGGGGSPIMATAGGADLALMKQAVSQTPELISNQLGNAP